MYAFNNENGIVQTAVFYPDDVLAGDRFGESLSVSNDLIAIGAAAHQNTGAVYTYKKQNGNWEFLQKIMPADGNPDDYFGSAVKISGEYLFISATGDEIDGDPANTDSGSVWVYKWNGNYAVVGAPKEGTGKAYTINASLLSSRSFSNNDVSLYPNSTSDIVKIAGDSDFTAIEVYSITGKLLHSNTTNLAEISLKEFASGIYFIRLRLTNGEQQP